MWTGWTRCPVMCGGANVTRTRLCNAPVPSNGGRFCNGSSTDSMICGNSTCPGNKSIIIFLFIFLQKRKEYFFPSFWRHVLRIHGKSVLPTMQLFCSLEIPPGFEMMSCFNASMFVCESGEHCVPKSMRCDIKLNCHDGTDEKDCIISLGMGINCK